MAHTLTLWTSDPELAEWADRAGVERVGLDLETLGKAHRQAGLATWISPHTLADLDCIRPALRQAELFVRTNPFHPGSRAEVEALLERDVEVLMLPNFRSLDEVSGFVGAVDGRARVVPLVERLDAVALVPALAELGVRELHVGLNDLSIDLGLGHRLGALVSPVMDELARGAGAAGLAFGVGGLARALDNALPVPSDLVYAQHARLGSTAALIARSFFRRPLDEAGFRREIGRLRARLESWAGAAPAALAAARAELALRVAAAPVAIGA